MSFLAMASAASLQLRCWPAHHCPSLTSLHEKAAGSRRPPLLSHICTSQSGAIFKQQTSHKILDNWFPPPPETMIHLKTNASHR